MRRRPIGYVVRRINQIEGSQIANDRGRLRKTIQEIIKKDQYISEFNIDMIYDKTL